jgi:hypothetical protein
MERTIVTRKVFRTVLRATYPYEVVFTQTDQVETLVFEVVNDQGMLLAHPIQMSKVKMHLPDVDFLVLDHFIADLGLSPNYTSSSLEDILPVLALQLCKATDISHLVLRGLSFSFDRGFFPYRGYVGFLNSGAGLFLVENGQERLFCVVQFPVNSLDRLLFRALRHIFTLRFIDLASKL